MHSTKRQEHFQQKIKRKQKEQKLGIHELHNKTGAKSSPHEGLTFPDLRATTVVES